MHRVNSGKTPPIADDVDRSALVACAAVFASAVKNLTIYPPSHPRVAARAGEFVQRFAEHGRGRCEVIVIGDALAVDGAPVPGGDPSLPWLASRCRLAGLRGVAIEPGCTTDDVVAFATALIACRPGTTRSLCATWDREGARVAPLELVVEEHHAPGGRLRPGELPPRATGTAPLETLGKGLSEKLAEVAQRPEVREILRSIEDAAHQGADGGGPGEPRGVVDLLGTIGELLPVDAPTTVDELSATVEHILGKVRDELTVMIRQDARVRGAGLLRSAVGIARGYFRRPAPTEVARQPLPSGRPEDARIVADRDALLAEYAQLPELTEQRLPAAREFESSAPAMGRELLGIYLHGLRHDPKQEHRARRIELIARLLPTSKGTQPMLDAYLGPKSPLLPPDVRLALLGAMADAGLAPVVHERGYLTQELLTRCFPDSLPVAAKLCGDDQDQVALVRRVLNALAPMLVNGAAAAAEAGGHLAGPAVAGLLARIGGKPATLLLSHCEAADPASHAALRDFAARIPLPTAEAHVLRLCPVETVPTNYLRRILRAHAVDAFDASVRQTSAALLRERVASGRQRLTLPAMLDAIGALQFVPDEESLALLRRLARAGRFVNFTAGARAVRRRARETLDAIEQELQR